LPNALRSPLLALALAAFVFGCANVATAAVARHSPVPQPPRARTVGERLAALALKEVGVPYRWGGISPATGFDCSGLVYWAYRRLGVNVPHSTYALADLGREIPRTRMRRGDLLFFFGLGHVGIYLGHGKMVHAPHTGSRVQVVNLKRYGAEVIDVRRISS
jgi:cell wall-associated NlpC family hydrolase